MFEFSNGIREACDLVLSYTEVCQVGEVAQLGLHLPDPVEPQVECGQGGEAVDHGGDVDQTVVPAVQHTQVLQIGQLVWQAGDHILRQTQGGQVDQTTNFWWQSCQSVAVEIQLGQMGQLLQTGRQQRDVGLGQVQSLSTLLLARQKCPRKVKIS